MIQGLAAIRDNNFNMIQQMYKLLEDEEASDNQMRAQFQARWARLPSASLT
jgi:ABC-type lipoprotein export system ATPase subunit